MSPSLIIADIPFYDTPPEIVGSPYWVDLWTDVNGYKVGLQVKPSSYRSANMSIYMGGAKTAEEQGHKLFLRYYGGEVFVVTPKNGSVSMQMEKRIKAYCEKLLNLPSRNKNE